MIEVNSVIEVNDAIVTIGVINVIDVMWIVTDDIAAADLAV